MFLQEAARRAAEAKEAAKVDPWESDKDEEEEKDAAVAEEEDPLRGQRMHAWVRQGKREGETGGGRDGLFVVVRAVVVKIAPHRVGTC